MDPVSAVTLLKALDGLARRAEVTANNIANANSPGFRPSTVRFEEALAAAARSGVDAVKRVAPETTYTSDPAEAAGVRLDLQLIQASTTAGRYGALAEVLNRQLQLVELAVTGNA